LLIFLMRFKSRLLFLNYPPVWW